MKENKVFQPEQIVVRRSEIHAAAYNPRKITPEAAKLLKENLKRVGLLGGVIWNRTTGNLVSGHQRVAQMDAINRYDPENPDTDYEFKVEVVEMDEKTEKEQNLFLNNRNAQGEFDDDMLRQMFDGIDYSLAGFDDFDLQMLGFGDPSETVAAYLDASWRESQITGEGYQAEEGAEKNEEMADKSAEFKAEGENTKIDRSKNFYEDTKENQLARHAEIQKIKDRIVNQNDINKDGGLMSYITISFQSPSECDSCLDLLGLPFGTKYIRGKDFLHYLEFGTMEADPEQDEENE